MSTSEIRPASLTARRNESGVVSVEIAGNWLDRTALPEIGPVEKELAVGGVRAVEFAANQLGRWDSALMVRILAINDLCDKGNVEFRAKTLPDGLAKLIALSRNRTGKEGRSAPGREEQLSFSGSVSRASECGKAPLRCSASWVKAWWPW